MSWCLIRGNEINGGSKATAMSPTVADTTHKKGNKIKTRIDFVNVHFLMISVSGIIYWIFYTINVKRLNTISKIGSWWLLCSPSFKCIVFSDRCVFTRKVNIFVRNKFCQTNGHFTLENLVNIVAADYFLTGGARRVL